jgi:hypothetical protein
MDSNCKRSRPELPKSILGRIAFGTICLPLFAFSGVFSYAFIYGILFCGRAWDTREGAIAHRLAGVIFESLFLFSLLGLIWAMSAPEWIARLLQWAAFKLTVLLMLFSLFGLPFAIWALCKV